MHGFRDMSRPLMALMVLLLGACSLPFARSPAVADKVYLLEWSDPAPAALNPRGPSLWMRPLTAAAGFEDPDMVYVRRPLQLEHYAHHRWADAPARMLEPLLLQALEDSGLFSSVAGPEESVRSDLRLDGKLLYLRQVFSGGDSEMQLALRVSLVDTRRLRLVASRVFSITQPVTGDTPYDAAQAANRAVARLLSALRRWLEGQQLPAPA